jgi:hypothetical protein
MMECMHCGNTNASLRPPVFCVNCGKADRAALESIGLQTFTGPASLSPSVERFWETGDPDVL